MKSNYSASMIWLVIFTTVIISVVLLQPVQSVSFEEDTAITTKEAEILFKVKLYDLIFLWIHNATRIGNTYGYNLIML